MSNYQDDARTDNDGEAPPTVVEAGFSRRSFVSVGAAAGIGLVAAAAASGQTLQSAKTGEANTSAGNPGPENTGLRALSPSSDVPPPTDHGGVQQFWQSFSQSRRRIQDGGWSRQINIVDFPISKDIAGVNMKLNAGAIRELHWHAAAEWSLMLTGTGRITALDVGGSPFVKDVKAGDLWYFPQGIPHSIQGLGPDGCEFLLVFDQGTFSEEDTTLLTDWLVHTPREVLAKNFGVEEAALQSFDTLPSEGRYIFPAPVPPALSSDVQAMAKDHPLSKQAFAFSMLDMKPTKENASGSIRIVDSNLFKVSKTIAAAYVVVKPGALRELHWHPNADEWQYYVSGKGRMTLFMNHSNARTLDFTGGDVGYVPVTMPHYIENTGTDDLVFLEMFKSAVYQDVSLNNWMRALPLELLKDHLNIADATVAAIPRGNSATVPFKS